LKAQAQLQHAMLVSLVFIAPAESLHKQTMHNNMQFQKYLHLRATHGRAQITAMWYISQAVQGTGVCHKPMPSQMICCCVRTQVNGALVGQTHVIDDKSDPVW
jgi:hypothetical protein